MKKLIPHIYFNGNCLEAVNHYIHVFKGEIESIDKYKDQPIEVDEEHSNKIYFCHFALPFGEFYASDKLDSEEVKQHFWVHFDNEDELLDTAQKLSQETILQTQQSAFGEQIINFQDHFGLFWSFIFRN